MGGRQHLAPTGEREDGQGVLRFDEQPPVEDKPQVLPAIDSSSSLEALLVEQLESIAPEDEDGYRGRLAILAEAVALVLEDCMGQASKTQALLIRTQRVNPTVLALRARWGEEEAKGNRGLHTPLRLVWRPNPLQSVGGLR